MLYIKDDMKTSTVTLATSSGKEQITILGSRTPENEMKSYHKIYKPMAESLKFLTLI